MPSTTPGERMANARSALSRWSTQWCGPDSCLGRHVLGMVVFGMFFSIVLLMALNLLGMAEFWTLLPKSGERVSPRVMPMLAACESLQTMVLVGGREAGADNVLRDMFVYEFQGGKVWQVQVPEEFEARYGGYMKRLDFKTQHVFSPQHTEVQLSAGKVCNFLLHGGLKTTGDMYSEGEPANSMWLLQLYLAEGVPKVDFRQILDFTGAGPLKSRFQAEAVVYNSSMFVLGGRDREMKGSNLTVYRTLHRFQLNETSLPTNRISGEWQTYTFANTKPRYNFAATVMSNYMIVHGGLQEDGFVDTNLMMERYDLNLLGGLHGASSNSEYESAYKAIPQKLVLKRHGHVMVSWGSLVFIYGGWRERVSNGQSIVEPNDYVLATSIDLEENLVSCSPSRSRSAEWCGSVSQFPGTSELVDGFGYDDSMILFRYGSQTGNTLYQMDISTAVKVGDFFDAEDFETPGPLYVGSSLRYVLVVACIFLLFSLVILFRNRHYEENFQINVSMVQKRGGISKSAIETLPLVKYRKNGRHIPVVATVDSTGNKVYTEVTQPPPARSGRQQQQPPDHSNWEASESGNHAESFQHEPGQDDTTDTDEDLELICSICICEFEEDEILMELPCKHLFHDDCLEDWLERKGICPLCRRHVIHGRVEDASNTTSDQLVVSSVNPAARSTPSAEAPQISEQQSRRISQLGLGRRASRRLAEIQMEIELEERSRSEVESRQHDGSQQERAAPGIFSFMLSSRERQDRTNSMSVVSPSQVGGFDDIESQRQGQRQSEHR